MNKARRNFLKGMAFLGAGLWASRKARAQHHPAQHEGNKMGADRAISQSLPKGESVLVVTPDVPKLPYKLENGVKVFHLVAEPVKREILPGKVLDVWGYSGSMPGPTIEVMVKLDPPRRR